MSIAFLKYFAADRDLASGSTFRAAPAPATGKHVGIIGGGPAGLTAAYYLALKGHSVTVYDAMPKMGGMLRYGIPEYRLPKATLDREIEEIASVGDITYKNNFMVGRDASLADLRAAHDAVIIAIGAWTGTPVGCPGEDLEGVYSGIDFLREVALGGKPAIGDRVAVMGGGNVAMDACRTAVRLGAKKVYIIYRRTKAEMPADQVEIEESEEEGVIYKLLTNPAEFVGENGRVKEVKLQIMELGAPDASGRRSPVPVEGKFEYLPVDSAIAAFGQKLNLKGFEDIELNRRGNIAADEASFRTNLTGVFAVGDATNKGADIAISAIGEAGKAAAIVDAYLNGVEAEYHKPFVSERKVTEADFTDRERAPRAVMPARPAEERKNDFEAVYLGFSEEVAQAEAKRCLECGCHDYKDCSLICHANRYPIDPSRFAGDKHKKYVEQRLVSIERDQGKCLLCGLCVRICDSVANKGILGLVGRGFTTAVKPEFNDPKTIAGCADCLKCAVACPTGALKILKK
jgi:formate dehydrogenase major subunit